MLVSPTVVSVPKTIKCLSLSETRLITDLVGAPETIVARVVNALVETDKGSHSNVCPFLIVHNNFCPKWSRDQVAGSSCVVEDNAASPHPIKYSTPAPELCADLVPPAPLVIPVRSFEDTPV